VSKEPIQMKSSQDSKQTPPPRTNVIPQFVSAVFINDKGEMEITYHLIGGFPKTKVLPGLLTIAGHFKATLLDNLAPDPANEEMVEVLEDMITDEHKAVDNALESHAEALADIIP